MTVAFYLISRTDPQPYAQSHQSVPSYYPGQQSIQQPYAQNGTPSANSLSPQVIKEDGDILWPRLPDPKNFKETRLVDDFVNDNKHDPFYMFRISHRDANSLLSVRLDSHRLEVLPQEYRKLIAKPGMTFLLYLCLILGFNPWRLRLLLHALLIKFENRGDGSDVSINYPKRYGLILVYEAFHTRRIRQVNLHHWVWRWYRGACTDHPW